MSEKPKKYIFNLMKPIEKPKSSWDKVYEWITTRARVVVLIAEILIVIGFIGKVFVDNDAKNKYQQYKLVADNVRFFEQTQEEDFRRLQLMESDYRELWGKSSNFTPIINEIFGYIQNPASRIVITLNKNEAVVTGTNSLTELESLEKAMKSSVTFLNANINRLALNEQDIENGVAEIDLQADLPDTVITRQPIP